MICADTIFIHKPTKFFFASALLFLLLGIGLVNGANRTASVSGNWNSTTTWGGAAVPTSADDVFINNGITVTMNSNPGVCNNLTINGTLTASNTNRTLTASGNLVISGGTINNNKGNLVTLNVAGTFTVLTSTTASIEGVNLTIAGTTNIAGTLTFDTANTGTKIFTGLFTVAATGTIINSIGESVTFRGGLNNNGAFTAGTGIYTFDTNSQAITGTLSIPNVTVTGITLTNNGALTVATVLTGTGGLTQSAAGTLNLGGTSTITTLTANAAGNAVNYTAAAQTVKPATYYNLTISGSGVKTTTGVTVNGVLSMEGTATASVAPTYGATATLKYNTATARTAGAEWITPFVATGGVVIANTGAITLNSAKVFNTSVPLTINSGSTLHTSASNFQLTLGGDFRNSGGTLTANASPVVIAGTVAGQIIDGFTTTGIVSMTKTAGTATIMGNVNGSGLTINGAGGILNLGAVLTHTFTGASTITAGTLNGGSSLLKIGGSVSGTGGTFTAGTGTVEWSAGGAQTVAPVAYNNLIFSGSGAKSISTGTSVTGNLSINGATANIGTGLNISVGSLTMGGLNKVNGTWGSTSSTATNKDNTYFAATNGYVTVTTDTRPTSAISGVTASQSICFGTATITLTGTVSSGAAYPAIGETVGVTINGVTQNATIAGGVGGFSINFTTPTIPSSATPYTITYSYAGGVNLKAAANNTTTALTVSPLPVAAGTITGTSAVCQGATSIAYNVPVITNATSYTWAYSGTGATITGTTNSVTITFAANATTGNLTVRGTNICGSGTVSANYAIAVNPLPIAAGTITGTSAVCQGAASVAYSVPAIANATSYTWAYSGTGATVSGSTASMTINFSATATSGNLTVTGTNTCGNGPVSANYAIAITPVNNITVPASVAGNSVAILSWINPASCYDGIMIVAKAGSSVTGIPSGDGTAYTANLAYGSGTAFTGGGFVVYKSSVSPQTVTGLTNGTQYYFKFFTRKGTVWSSGIETNATPADVSLSSDYFRSRATGNWNANATWESSHDGTNWFSSTLTPTSTANTITIQNTHTVTVTANVTVDQVTVNVGGQVTVNSGQTLTIADGTGTDLIVAGTMVNSGLITTTGTMAFNSGSAYQHTRDGGTIPSATWDAASTCSVTGITASAPTGFGQIFGNFIWNCVSQTVSTYSTDGDITINGNFTLNAGVFTLNNGTALRTLTINGNYIQTGGTFDFNIGTSGNSNIYLVGNLSLTAAAGSMTTNGTGAPNGIITFNGSGIQTMNIPTVGASIWVKYSIPSGKSVQLLSNITLSSADLATQPVYQGEITVNGTLDLSTFTVTQNDGIAGTAVFTVNSGANLISANATGISGSVSATNMTNTFSSGANYEFRGAATGTFTTTATANTVNNLTINRSSGVTLSQNLIVSGTLNLTSGILTTGANTVTLSNNSTNAVTGGSATSFVNGPLIWQLAAGQTYSFPIGKGATYLPFGLTGIAGTTPGIRAEAFLGNVGGTATAPLVSLNNTEYWLASVASGTYTNGSVSLTRSTALAGLNAIGRNTTTINGAYSNLNGTISSNSILNSDITGNSLGYFVMATKRSITTSAITGSSFCSGTGVNVPYSIAGTFNSGNIFTAQLSNASGNFSVPVTIGTYAGTTAVTISGTIPAVTASGSGYRIRVISSNPAVNGSDNGSDITVTTIPVQPGIIIGSATPCQTSLQTYSVTNVAGVTYTWTFPAGWTQTAGGTTNSITVTVGASSGNVQVTPSNACGNGTAQTLAVTSIVVPAQPGVITGSSTPCQTSSQIYSVTNVVGVTYTWTFPAGWTQTAGGTTNSVIVTVGAGSGNVQVTPSNTCGNGIAQTLVVTPTLVPTQPGVITGSATPCQTTSQIYSVNNVAGVSYTWTFPAGWTQTAGGTTNSVTVSVGAGSGNVQATPSNTCGNGTIRTLAVTPILVPAQPGVITGSATPCQTSSQIFSVTNVAGVTYTWTFPAGWVQTAGGTTNSVTVTVGAGSGNVQVTPSNACGNGPARTLAVTTGLTISSPVATGALICIGSTATLSASGAIAGNKYNWYDAASSGTLLKTSLDNTDNTYLTPVLPATTNYWVSILSSGGCESSRTQVTATYPTISTDDQNVAGTNSWIGHVYDGLNLDTYIGHYTELELFDQSFGGDYTCFNVFSNSISRSIYTETFSVRFRMNSTKKGLYVVDMGADDGIRLSVDGTLLSNNWVDQAYTSRPLVLMNLTGASSIVYDYYENGGGNRVVFQNLTSVLSNTITTNTSQIINIGSSGLAIIGDAFGTLPAGITLNGTGYQWTYSTTPLGVRTNIAGATGATYTPNASGAPFNVPGTYYIYRNATLSSANNVNPNPYIATNESNASTLIINNPPTITVSPASLTGFSYTVGSGPSAQQSFTVGGTYLTANISVTPSTNFEISTTSGSGFQLTPITLTQVAGTVATTTIYVRLKTGLAVGTYAAENIASTSTGATTQNVACSGTVVNIPLITASTTTLTGFTYNVGSGPSVQQSFTVGGTYLIANLIVTPSTDFEISTTSGSGFQLTPITLTQVAGTVATTTIYVRLKAGLVVGNYTAENIASTSTGAVTKNVVCSGTVVVAPLVTVSLATLTGFSYTVGSGPSAQQLFTVGGTNLTANIIVNPSTNYEISTTSGSGFQLTPITLTQASGTVATTTIYVRLKTGLAVGIYPAENIASTSTGAVTKNVACSGTVVNIPLITTSLATLTGFRYVSGSGPSTQQSFTVNATGLTANLIVTPPTDFEISLTSGVSFVASNPISITPTSGTVAATTIYVRLKAGLAIGSYAAENITMTSTNAITKNVACSGTVTNIPVITISPTILTEFSYIIGAGPSSQQSFTVGGVNLLNPIIVTPPTDYEISLTSGVSFVATNPISFTPTGGSVPTTTIYVRLKAGLAGNIYAGENIALTSTSATTQNVACSGVVNAFVQIWKGGTLQASFSTLKFAFDAINAGTYTGILDIKINGSIVDNSTATLYQSGYTGAGSTSNYSSVIIYPTVAGITLSGSMAAPLIDLNGADNVTIDGSVNALGSTKSLIISNTSTSAIAGTSTIRFINSAENNNVNYCIIKGSETSTTSGVISFSTASAGNGNDKNTIDNNDITSNAAGRPINAIYSLGSASFENSGNIILNNNIFDFWNASNSSSAIQLGPNTTDFTISLNSFYETTSFLPNGAFNYKMIWINNPTGNNFVVSTNYIGGSTSLCGGAALSLGATGTVQSVTLDPIEINAGNTAPSSIQGNIIKNISLRSSDIAPFRAINVVAGTLNIGTEAGNTIGLNTGIGSITVTSTNATGNVYGIYIASGNTVDCQNNNIGSITTANSNAANATNLYGIYKSSSAGTTTISRNVIGSLTTPNSLNTSSTATANSQLLYGIYSAGTGNTTISTNTIANITNSTTETTLASRLRGILTEGGSNDINNNEVHHLLSRGAANGANYPNTSLIGISQVSKLAGNSQNVSGNSVYNLTNTSAVKMEMYGIYYDGPAAGTNTISRNFVHSYYINSTDAAYLHGISLYGGAFTASNNIVYLGNTITTGCSMWAMWTNSTNSIRIYHNTLYLGGIAASGASNTYAFRSLNAGPTDAIIKNNILWNNRTNSSNVISHYAIFLQSAANTSVDYNDFRFYQQFGLVGATAYASFATWKAGTGFDTNSTEADPLLVNLGGTLPTDYQTSVPLDGVPGTGILTDFNNIVRSTIAPTMGAWEYFSNPVEVWNGTTFRKGYNTLKGAFDKINDGTWTGDLIIKFKGNTIETASAMLNASGTGLSNYTKILIYPSRLGVTVTGSLAAPMVDLNGCDNITFDGRKDASGTASEITFSNTSTSNVAGTSTFRFINDANNNIIKNCTIKGSSTDAGAGVIFFSTTTGTTGNDGNTIDNNSITNAADANRPLNVIYSSGTSAKENSGNTISNNNIFDFLNKGIASNGINLGNYTTAETIQGNSFYETASFAPTASVSYNIINISSSAGVNYSISGNFIGGSSASCGGTGWTKLANTDNIFTAISMSVGTGTASNIQNNTIQKIAWSNSGAAAWTGINIASGDANVGAVIANTIGAATGTGSVTVTNATTGANVYGINIASSGTVDCQNNIIASITTTNAAANATNFYGIYKTASAGIATISNNTIGNAATANSINTSSASTGNAQSLYGIYNAGTGAITISNNVLVNLSNSTTNAAGATSGLINGIFSSGGTNTISNNTIRNLTIANANTAATSSAAVGGIVLTGSSSTRTITGNTVYNLSNTYAAFAGRVVGIYYEGSTSGTNIVSKNFIYSLSTSGTSGAGLFGIWIVSGVTTYSNNIVNLGSANQNLIYGVYDTGAASQTCYFYFNTIYIGGVVAAGAYNSYTFYSAAANNTRNYRNNILSNARSNTAATGTHFAIYFAATGGNLVINYNDYYAPATGGVLGYYNGANRTTLALWQAATAQDNFSLNNNPTFVNAGSTIATDYKIAQSLIGIAETGITIDYGSVPRGTPPTMGVWEANINKWKGSTSIDWNTSSNWTANIVPAVDATIIFDDIPVRHCQLDKDRSVTNIINAQGVYRMVTNGHKLTVKGDFNFTNGAQIDASATNSNIELAGSWSQTIPAGIFYNNQVYDLTVNNSNNVTLYGTMRLLHLITANAGRLDANITTPTFVYAGSSPQTIESNRYLGESIYNLSIDNLSGVALANTAAITVPHDLTITKGVLTIPPGALLTVDNFTKLDYRAPMPVPYPLLVDYWSCLVLKSNATSTGSFIHTDLFTGIGTVKVERFMSHTNNWHLCSSPIKDQSMKDFLKYNPEIPDLFDITVTPNVLIGVGIRDYLTSTDVWSPYFIYANVSSVAGTVGKGKGFNIRTYNDVQGTGTVDATGIPNPNTVNVALTRSALPTDKGWNCIGNPFTSAINIKEGTSAGFLNNANANNLDPAFVAVYVWDTNNITSSRTTPEYIVLNNATSITSVQISQGFFVKSKAGGGNVTFTKAMQSPNSALTFKAATVEWPSIKIVATNQVLALSSSTEIKFIPNTTKGLDLGYDAGIFKANPNFSLFSKLVEDNAIDFTLQCLPDQDYDQYVIPIGFDCKVGGELTFTAESINLPSGCKAVLEDRVTKRFTRLDLDGAKYTVLLSPDTKGTGRFFLHTTDVISSDQPLEKQPFKVYTIGKSVYINGEVSDEAQFYLYSVIGKQLANFKAESQVQNRLDASGFPAGMYLLTIIDKKQKKTIKFLLGN